MAREIRTRYVSEVNILHDYVGEAPTLSVLIIGTATDGPAERPVLVRSMREARRIFGDIGRGTLLEGYHEFILGASDSDTIRTVAYLMRLDTGRKASVEIPESSSGSGASAAEEPPATALRIDALYAGASYNDISIHSRYTSDGPAVVITLPGSKDPSGETTEYYFHYDLSGIDTTKINTLNELAEEINRHPVLSAWIQATVVNIPLQFAMNLNFGGDDDYITNFTEWAAGVDSEDNVISLAERFEGSPNYDNPTTGDLGRWAYVDMDGNTVIDTGLISAGRILRSSDSIVEFRRAYLHKPEEVTISAGYSRYRSAVPIYPIYNHESTYKCYPILALTDYDNDGFRWSRYNYVRKWNATSAVHKLPVYPVSEGVFRIDNILNPDGSVSGNRVEAPLFLPLDVYVPEVLEKVNSLSVGVIDSFYRWVINTDLETFDINEEDTDNRFASSVSDVKIVRLLNFGSYTSSELSSVNVFKGMLPYKAGTYTYHHDVSSPTYGLVSDLTYNLYSLEQVGIYLDNPSVNSRNTRNNVFIVELGEEVNGTVRLVFPDAGDLSGHNINAMVYIPSLGSWAADDVTVSCGVDYIDVTYSTPGQSYNKIQLYLYNATGSGEANYTILTRGLFIGDTDLTSNKVLATVAYVNSNGVLGTPYGLNYIDMVKKDWIIGGLLSAYYKSADDYPIHADWTASDLNNLLSAFHDSVVDHYNTPDFALKYSTNGEIWNDVPITWTDSTGKTRLLYTITWEYNGEEDMFEDSTDRNKIIFEFVPDADELTEEDALILSSYPFLDVEYDGSSVNVSLKSGFLFRVVGYSTRFELNYVTHESLLSNWNDYTVSGDYLVFKNPYPWDLKVYVASAYKMREGIDYSYSRSEAKISILNDELIPDTSVLKNVYVFFDYEYEPEWFDTTRMYLLSGGSDGIDELTNTDLRNKYESALEKIKSSGNFAVIVPKGAYIDLTDNVFDPDTGRRVEMPVDFLGLFDEFTKEMETEAPTTVILSPKPIMPSGSYRFPYTADQISDFVDRLTNIARTDADAVAPKVSVIDNPALMVVANPVVLNLAGITYIGDATAYIAGVMASLAYDYRSASTATLTNYPLTNGVRGAFMLTPSQEEALLGMRYTVINRADNRWRIVRDYTLTAPTSAFYRATHRFIIHAIRLSVERLLRPYIGQMLTKEMQIAIESSVDRALMPWVQSGIIQDYKKSINWAEVSLGKAVNIIPVDIYVTRSVIVDGFNITIHVK